MDGKIVIITNGNYFARLILDDLFRKYTKSIIGVLIITGDYRGNSGIRSLWQVGKETAFPYLVYKLISIIAFSMAQKLNQRAKFSVGTQAEENNIPVKFLKSIKTTEAISWVIDSKPDLIVSVSCPQLIGKKILASARLGGINIHSSLLPAYAGLAPYFWVLSRGEKESGTTVHYMTSEFDKGNILLQRKLDIRLKESAFGLFKRLAFEGSTGLVEAVEMALSGNPGIRQDLSKYSYFSNPSFSAYRRLKQNGHALMRLGELWSIVYEEINGILNRKNALL